MEIVTLKVGGKTFQTTKETLSSEKNSYFDILINGNFEKNKDNVYFIDRDPKFFRVVLFFLRHKKCDFPLDLNIVQQCLYIKEFEFYGMELLVRIFKRVYLQKDTERYSVVLYFNNESSCNERDFEICYLGSKVNTMMRSFQVDLQWIQPEISNEQQSQNNFFSEIRELAMDGNAEKLTIIDRKLCKNFTLGNDWDIESYEKLRTTWVQFYKDPKQSSNHLNELQTTIEYIKNQKTHEFELNLLFLVGIFYIFPVGTYLEFSNGTNISSFDFESAMKPLEKIVKILEEKVGEKLLDWRSVHLSRLIPKDDDDSRKHTGIYQIFTGFTIKSGCTKCQK
jgi:hypothetical protein